MLFSYVTCTLRPPNIPFRVRAHFIPRCYCSFRTLFCACEISMRAFCTVGHAYLQLTWQDLAQITHTTRSVCNPDGTTHTDRYAICSNQTRPGYFWPLFSNRLFVKSTMLFHLHQSPAMYDASFTKTRLYPNVHLLGENVNRTADRLLKKKFTRKIRSECSKFENAAPVASN